MIPCAFSIPLFLKGWSKEVGNVRYGFHTLHCISERHLQIGTWCAYDKTWKRIEPIQWYTMESSLNRGNWLRMRRGKTWSHGQFYMFVVEDDMGDSCGMGEPLCFMSASELALENKVSEVDRIWKEEFMSAVHHYLLFLTYYFIYTLMICHMVGSLVGYLSTPVVSTLWNALEKRWRCRHNKTLWVLNWFQHSFKTNDSLRGEFNCTKSWSEISFNMITSRHSEAVVCHRTVLG